MKREELLRAVGDISDEALERGDAPRERKALHIRRFVAVAAALAVCAGACFGAARFAGSHIGGNDVSDGPMSYQGPVLPLTALTPSDGLAAERYLEFDFSGFSHTGRCAVVDRYTLTNETDEPISATLAYPAVGSLADPELPRVTVDGEAVEPRVVCGAFTGELTGEDGERRERLVGSIESWEGYRELLSDGSYMDAAFSPAAAPDTPVTVYKLHDITAFSQDAVSPNVQFEAVIDYDRTAMLSYGFNGGRYDREGGLAYRNSTISAQGGDAVYIALVGDDVKSYEIGFYGDGGCDEGDRIEGSAEVERYETTLGEFLRERCLEFRDALLDNPDAGDALYLSDPDLLFREVCRCLAGHGTTDGQGARRYDTGMLEEIMSDAALLDRVLYLVVEVTVEPHGSVAFETTAQRMGSFYYQPSGREREGLRGFDAVTTLGSALTFSRQRVGLNCAGEVELVLDETGFAGDPAAGAVTAQAPQDCERVGFEVKIIKRD